MGHRGGALALVVAPAAGCVVVADGPEPSRDAPPAITRLDAGCAWAPDLRANIWYFQADTDDPDGPLDVMSVVADVVDTRTQVLVESFEVFPTNDPRVWYSDWYASSTRLDCAYRGYVVDFTATDTAGAVARASVVPLTL